MRVVITGTGVVSPLGLGSGRVFASILQGESGVRSLLEDPQFTSQLDRDVVSKFPCQVAGIIPSYDKELLNKHRLAKSSLSKSAFYAIVAAEEAQHQANWFPEEETAQEKTGACISSTWLTNTEQAFTNYELHKVNDIENISSEYGYNCMTGNIAALVGSHLKIKGPVNTISTPIATGLHSVVDAFLSIQRGDANVMFAGGADCPLQSLTIMGLSRKHCLSTKYNKHPSRACRPFDSSRDGVVISEGAAVLTLESYDHAVERKAAILGELLGFGMSADNNVEQVFHLNPGGNAVYRSMKQALNTSNISSKDLCNICAAATSSITADKEESYAIHKLLKDTPYDCCISSTKGATGNMFGASGVFDLVMTLMSLQSNKVFPMINLINVSDCAELKYSRTVNELNNSRTRNIALINSLGILGLSASVCIAKV